MAKRTVDFFFKDSASQTLACVASVSSRVIAQGREEMCLSLEHQNSEKMGYFDRVTVSLHILETANQETEGSQDRLTVYFVPRSPFGRRAVRQRGYGLRLLIFKMANNKVDLGQIRSEEIVYSRFIKIPLG